MRCSNCGNELPENAMFCDNCGQKAPQPIMDTGKMFCGNCGAEIKSGTEFCGMCGTPIGDLGKSDINYIFCGNCGERIPDNLQTCPNCGQNLYADNNELNNNELNNNKEADDKKQAGKKYGIIIIILVVIILALAAMISGYFIYDNSRNKSDDTDDVQVTVSPMPSETPAATPTSSDNLIESDSISAGKLETYYVVNCSESISLRENPSTSSNILKDIPLGSPVSYVEASQNGFAKIIYDGTTGYALQSYLSNNADDIRKPNNNNPPNNGRNTSSTVVSNPTYKTYNDTLYNFSCSYPAHFQVYTDSDKFVRYALKAPDNSATLKICATTNSSNLSVNTVMNNFKSSYPGTVDYENSGDTWCAISTIKDNQHHYGYFSIKNGMIRGFEMHYSQGNDSIYDNYVNDIYNSLKLN